MTMKQASTSSLTADAARPREGVARHLRTIARETGLVAAGTAAIALIGQISLPLPFTPVPVTLGTLAVLGVGAFLGSRRAVASALLLAALAALGAPVLAGWGSGVTASFGYVLGYALVGAIAGRATAPGRGVLARLGLMLAASAAVYIPGLLWLKAFTGLAWSATLTLGLAPFVVGDLMKSGVAALAPTRR
ncbi:biotin transporter BioY [Actinomyces oricola]